MQNPRILALYKDAQRAQWNASADLDWSIIVPFGSALPDDSALGLAAFEVSPLAQYGRPMWDLFRWEFHAWIASQFVHGEQAAFLASTRLTEMLPGVDARCFSASQVADEARHVEAFSRYVREKMPHAYAIASPLAAFIRDILSDARWDITTLGLQIILEGLAMATLRIANSTLHDGLIRQITRLATRDEARHIAFGIFALKGIYPQLTEGERAEREEIVIEAAVLMQRWFVMDELWDRVGIDRAEGVAFATSNDMMIAYRQAVFAKAATSLSQIGLMTDRVRTGLERLNLLSGVSRRALVSNELP